MFRAFKYKINPNKEQKIWLEKAAGSNRWLWNYMLDLNKKEYETKKKFVFAVGMANKLPALKQEHDWLKEGPSQSLQQTCMNLDAALKSVWKSGFGFPKFKAKGKGHDSFRIPQVIANGKDSHIRLSESHIRIPKIGEVKWTYHRPITGELKSITISRDVDHWYVSVLCQVPDVPQIQETTKERTIGLDLGVSSFAILSDGRKIESPQFLKKKLCRLARYQRQMQKRKLASKNREKARHKVARCHRDIRNQRLDWLHQESHKLVNSYDIICTEDMKTKQLMEKKDHGKSLNRAIADQGWGMFLGMIAYKTKAEGKIHTKISQWMPSTKTCSCCGHERKMKLSDRVYICENEKCADYLKAKDRDWNAALNIHFWGLMGTPGIELKNTEGTSGIDACGEPSANIESDRSDGYWGSLNQEAQRSLVAG